MLALSVILLILGFGFLIKGADWLVDGSGSLAKKFGLSELVIGLTVVAFGTSSPELFVNMLSAVRGSTDLALGNIVGSNIANVFLILGATAAIYPLAVGRTTVWRGIPFSLLAAVAVFFLANDVILDGAKSALLSRADGLALLLFFIIFLYYTYGIREVQGGQDNPDVKRRSMTMIVTLIVLGLGGLMLGAYWIVENAKILAAAMGISENVIGLTIVAFGTSLPELATSIMAAWRKNADIAVGNVVGSNIFNLLLVLAITSTITPIKLTPTMNLDLLVMIAASAILFLSLFLGRRNMLERREAIVMLVLYGAYMTSLALRG